MPGPRIDAPIWAKARRTYLVVVRTSTAKSSGTPIYMIPSARLANAQTAFGSSILPLRPSGAMAGLAMPDARDAVSKFVTAVERHPDVWRSFEVRVLAAQLSGEWHGIAGHVALAEATEGVGRFAGDMPRVNGLLVVRETLPVSELARVLGSVASGVLDLGRSRVVFSGISEHQRREPFHASIDVRPAVVSHPDVNGPYNTGYFLSLVGDSADQVLHDLGGPERVDRLLQVAANPYKDVSTFLRNGLRTQGGTSSGNLRVFSAWAPIGVVLDPSECRLSNRELRVGMRAGNRAAKNLTSIGWSGVDATGHAVARAVPVGHRRWSRTASGWKYQLTIPVRHMTEATVFLSVGDETFATHDLKVQPGLVHPLLAARSVEGEGNQGWKRILLQTKGSQAKEFEDAVAHLLTMLGLSVEPLYRKPNSNAVDLKAWVPGGAVLTCECTTGTLKGDGKLAKLVARTAAMRANLTKAGLSVRPGRGMPGLGARAFPPDQLPVVPVMFVSWPREQVSESEIEEAGRDGVAVLAREDIAQLIRLAEETASLSEIEGILRARIQRHGS